MSSLNSPDPVRPSATPAPAPTDAPCPLAELFRRSALGDESAFAELYDATGPRVFGLALRVIRNPAIADEVTQEVYLQAWQGSARYDAAKGSAMSWLLTLAHRRAVDRVRAAEASTRRDTAFHRETPTVTGDITAEGAASSIDADRVRAALKALSTNQQLVLQLAYFEGRTHSEIARITGVPVGTAKTRIRDGLIRLRGLVEAAA